MMQRLRWNRAPISVLLGLLGFLGVVAPAGALTYQGEAQEASANKKALAKELSELQAAFSKARTQLIKEMNALPEDERAAFYLANQPKPEEYVDRFFDIATRGAKTDTAVVAYTWILSHSQDDAHYKKCMEVLLRDHKDDESLVSLTSVLAYHQKGDEGLEKFIRQSANPVVRAHASYRLGKRYADRLDWGEGPANAKEKAEAYLESVVENHGDLKLDDGTTLGEKAKRVLFAMHNLVVGKVAPDIEGVDIDGVSFKLSDYRGKVVVLDFWGHW